MSWGRLAGGLLALAATTMACGARSNLMTEERRGSGAGSGGSDGSGGSGMHPPQRELDKLDILLAVDDSISMADKQRLLTQGVPDLIGRLANPLCVDAERRAFPELTPRAGEPCPRGPRGEVLEREFLPVSDVHVGVVTSSLGKAGLADTQGDDRAHLLGSLPGVMLPGVSAEGFLAWGPEKSQESFESEIEAMMQAVGDNGSGTEQTLEAWLRFLVDPEPYAELVRAPCSLEATECVHAEGIDETVLTQRRAFLRPDSVLLIVVLTDEDDCSLRIEPRNWELLDGTRFLARGNATCEVAPNDACCVACDVDPAPGCAPDPACADPLPAPREQHSNLRCFEQQRRFGRDVLQPIERYENALRERLLCPERADLSVTEECSRVLENPLFLDLERGGPAARTPAAVFLTFIVGVPWQDLATDPLALMDPARDDLVYKSPAELDADGSWDLLIGDTLEPPGDPLMLQSVLTRSGVHPITGEPVAGPEAWPAVNSINGHDRNIPNYDDLQYACTFPLPEIRDCTGLRPCDCSDPMAGWSPDNPMCQDASGAYSTWQHSGKAYPGQRHARLARLLGNGAVLSSICARDTQDPSRADFAYRPAVSALIGRIAPILKQPE